ncbi:MAG: single-stranded DNA-binding protein [Pseudothermotoga sp.]|uniref:single-stranded DNA-binding protein n=1 Tax=Pseudothermotoga sp. TaxID=2033661 RepID=UPI000AF3A299|nr:single-stranded DNA-binding protein [Pseudothermotoga sp.]HBT40445.1 single-stranded DNA-binding protein [Pseudothermotoga sp.]HCO97308.1 single-stranded DNA-binding protein [Pseudothermotoga sp.]
MPYYNRVILVGRLTRDPDTRMTTTGSAVASFTLAVDRPPRSSDSQRTTDFIKVVAFNKLADFVKLYLKKGQLVLVEGELRINKWQSRDGSNVTTPEIWARDIRFMEKKSAMEENVEEIEKFEEPIVNPEDMFGPEEELDSEDEDKPPF